MEHRGRYTSQCLALHIETRGGEMAQTAVTHQTKVGTTIPAEEPKSF